MYQPSPYGNPSSSKPEGLFNPNQNPMKSPPMDFPATGTQPQGDGAQKELANMKSKMMDKIEIMGQDIMMNA